MPGDTITYTIEADELHRIDQTTVADRRPLPTGTFARSGIDPGHRHNPVFRFTEYFIALGPFGGTVYDLTLDQNLAARLFRDRPGLGGRRRHQR